MSVITKFLTFEINGETCSETCLPGTSLLSLLHSRKYFGVHQGCATGDCGACTVWVDAQPVHSCIYPAHRIDGHAVTTIEGLAVQGGLTSMQQAFLDEQGFQCGYCTPGMIMSAAKLNYNSEAELRQALDGNLCRCTGYQAIINSIQADRGQNTNVSPLTSTHAQVGQNISKQDDPAIVTGKPIYAGDWLLPGLLHLSVLRSPHAHARIRRINTNRALALPGV